MNLVDLKLIGIHVLRSQFSCSVDVSCIYSIDGVPAVRMCVLRCSCYVDVFYGVQQT